MHFEVTAGDPVSKVILLRDQALDKVLKFIHQIVRKGCAGSYTGIKGHGSLYTFAGFILSYNLLLEEVRLSGF
jgi:hypothetical protein